MAEADSLEYRRGRLVLPSGITDWPPVQVGRWLARVPVSDRARAFRALPLNLAAAGFLTMDRRARLGLLCGLNPSNVRYLCSIARDGHLIDTLIEAGDDVEGLVLAALPDWRRVAISEQLASERARLDAIKAAAVDPPKPTAWRGPALLREVVERLRRVAARLRGR
jgi:hypothetical protein